MKKSILFLAGAALLFVGCAKVEDEAPIPENGKRVVTLKATVNEADTKVSVESDGTYQWQSGDAIGIWIVDGDGGAPIRHTTQDSGTTANFTVSLDAGEALGEYAFYPYSEDSFVGGDGPRFAMDANLDYVEGATNMPMLGTISSDGTISFKSVGGVIKLTVNNIPSNAAHLLFSAKDTNNENLVISGVFPVSGDIITAGGIMGVNSVNIDFTNKWKSSMEFYVPLPTGTYGGFELEFDNASSSETLVSKKVNFGSTGLTVERNQIIVAPALDAAPDYSGEWIMVGANGQGYYACPAYTGGNNIHGVEVAFSDNVVISYDNEIKMTFTKVTTGTYQGMYTIQDANNQYLYMAGASSNNYLKGESDPNNMDGRFYWDITPDNSNGFSIVASKATGTHNVLKFNTSDVLFSSYLPSANNVSNVSLYRWEDVVIETPTCATPDISCINNLITITCSTTDATIYYEIGTTESTTSDPTTASAVYDPSNKPSITADSYVKAIAIASGYNDSEVAGVPVYYTEPSEGVWTLVTDASTLAVGDVIVFASNSKGAVAGPLNGDFLTKIDATFSSDLNTIEFLPSDALQFTLGGSYNAWTLSCSEGQLYSQAAKKVNFSYNGTGTWKISSSNGVLNVANGNESFGCLQYNHNGGSNSRFTTYTSSQTAIQIYRKQATSPATDWSTVNESSVPLTLTDATNAVTAQVIINNVNYDALKVGASSSGSVRINKPAGKRYLHAHLAAWKGETVTVSIKNSAHQVIQVLSLTSDSGISGAETTFTLNGSPTDYYFKIDTKKTEELDLWFESTTGKRFVIWGVNASED